MLSLAALLGGALPGCASRGEPQAPAQTQTYSESISSVLVSEDGKHLAAIGRNHHYIFDAPELLVRALHSPVHPLVTATFSSFHVDQRGVVTGDYALALAADAGPDARRAAGAIGLAQGADGGWAAGGQLKGQRYTGWMYRVGTEQAALNKAYTIEFTTDFTRGDRAVDDAATPIRLAADGVQLIYYAPLAPIIIPFIFLTRARDH